MPGGDGRLIVLSEALLIAQVHVPVGDGVVCDVVGVFSLPVAPPVLLVACTRVVLACVVDGVVGG